MPWRYGMSRLIIDGYNLIGTLHGDLESRRKRLVKRLVRYRAAKGHDITVVFDGHGGLSPRETLQTDGGVRIVFSRIARKADDVIKDMLVQGGGGFIVVSSDREIADFAWARGSVPVGSGEFLRKLDEALLDDGEAGGGETMDEVTLKVLADEEEETGTVRKGASRRPSKRRKAVMRALNKL
ncbi:MAG TPA: hypothetical protein ENJ04_04120 [Nitrospirae bacterium]|nr:hypothetical protein [Nitrospirota bacterium]